VTYLLAQGDSWFDYPCHHVLERLEALGYDVDSIAHRGDTIESMAYERGHSVKLARMFEKAHSRGRKPKAILLSAGGNDIAGDELSLLLNHRHSGLPVLNQSMIEGAISERLSSAYRSLLSGVTGLSRYYWKESLPILVHGYGYPVPDGRGYLGGDWILPGPWLRPSFHRKGWLELPENQAVMMHLIDRFNAMLSCLVEQPGFEHVHYLDLRPVLQAGSYREVWSDELHPTKYGFGLVADRFASVLEAA
jgi:hypothetical protein